MIRKGKLLVLALVVVGVVTAAWAPSVGASHNVQQLVSIGPSGGNGSNNAFYDGASADGTRVFFETDEKLVPDDNDNLFDVYERLGNTTTLISTGPSGSSGADVFYDGNSADGTRVFFETDEQLLPDDNDIFFDIYERSGSTTTLISTGSSGGDGNFDVFYDGASESGTRVFFTTPESLEPGDTDSSEDVYERSSGTTTLISTGPDGGNGAFPASFAGSSTDGTRVFFETQESLELADSDSAFDIYERSGGTTKRVSTGPNGGNGNFGADFRGASDDGTRVFFQTAESLVGGVGGDTDAQIDVYERSGGTTTTLISTGPNGGNGAFPAFFDGSSTSGVRVFFHTQESLIAGTGGDADSQQDVYERVGTTTTRVSTGPNGGNGAFPASFDGASDSGTRVFFHTQESLIGGDTDAQQDVYERAGTTTTLISTGPNGGNGTTGAFFDGSSSDGTRVFFTTAESLVGADTDIAEDVYERAGGATTLLTIGPNGGNANLNATYDGASTDGTRVFFDTRESLVSADSDTARDVYVARVAPAAPASASSIAVSLVPIFRQCGTIANPANGEHSPPLDAGDVCLSPAATGVAHFGNQAVATAQLTVVPGNLATMADEADLSISANATDIRGGSPTGADYNPNASGADATLIMRLRITDLQNGPSGDAAGTTTELDFATPVNCANTASGTIGATCSASTSADAVTPGAIAEGKRSNIQVFRLRVADSGTNGVRGDSDDRLFAQQGVYIP